MTSSYFPVPSHEQLKKEFAGKTLHEVSLPSAILDVGILRQNCKKLLDAVNELQVSFRAHVKTHKTSELTTLQVGAGSKDVRLIVSTVIEAESLLDLLKQYQAKGAKVNVLYGVPLGRSHVTRLAALAKQLGPGTISAMIDNPAQLTSVKQFKAEAGSPLSVFIKTDSGYHRAGLTPESTKMMDLVKQVGEAESKEDLHLLGFYSHNSLSYGGNSPQEAMDMLKVEIDVCHLASQHLPNHTSRKTPLTISVGASPTALSIKNILPSTSETTISNTSSANSLRESLSLSQTQAFDLEIHAGVYPTFDLQQVAATSTPFPTPLDAHKTIALTILAEVISTYPDRTSTPEALISAGCLALAREPCKSYPGWGIVTSWNMDPQLYSAEDSVNAQKRIIVSRISQEHGILGREARENQDALPVEYGQRVRLWPNHACITGAGFGYYLVVDSVEGDGEKIVDVWVRWRGW